MSEYQTVIEDKHSLDLHEFVDILKYELDIELPRQTVIDTVHYLERRGFTIYKDMPINNV